MKKEKILKKGEKVIYWANYIKPSIATVEETLNNDEIAILDNKVRIFTYLNKEKKFRRPDAKPGYAIPLNEETQKIVDVSNFYHRLDLDEIKKKLSHSYHQVVEGEFEESDKILQVKRLINKINKVLE